MTWMPTVYLQQKANHLKQELTIFKGKKFEYTVDYGDDDSQGQQVGISLHHCGLKQSPNSLQSNQIISVI